MKKFFITLMCIIMVVCFMPTVALAEGEVVINADPTTIQDYLDGKYGPIDGKTIILSDGTYGQLELGRATKYPGSNTDYYIGGVAEENKKTYDDFVEIKNNGKWSASAYYVRNMNNVTIKAADGAAVTVAGITGTSGHVYGNCYDYVLDKAYTSGSAYYLTQNWNNITIEGITFTAPTNIASSLDTTVIDGVTFINCTFNINNTDPGNQALRYYNENNDGNVRNLTVENCSFNTCYQGVYTNQINGIKVIDSHFNKTGHNAIAVQSSVNGPVDHKSVVITGNTFNNIDDRIIRFGDVGADTQIIIKNNTATNSGDNSGQVIKAQSLDENVSYDICYNDWGEGKTVANNELKDGTAVAEVGNVPFTTLEKAIAAAKDGDTVKLLDDVGPITETLYINKNLTLDLGGKTLTTNAYYSFIVYPNISFTLQNGTLKNTSGTGIAALKSSTITVAKDAKIETAGSALFGSNNEADEGHVTFNVYGTLDCEYIGIWGQGPNNTFNVDGATITSKYFGVYQNGSFGGCKINIKNSTITDEAVDGTAVYISNNKWNAEDPKQGMQELTIENSIITGATAVEAKYTNINIKGSRTIITATGAPVDTTLNNNGPVTTGYAIAVTHNGNTNGNNVSPDSARGKITIEGGTFNGLIGIQEPLNATTAAEISVSGGKFNQELPKEYLAPGVVQDSKGNVYKPYYGGSIPTDSLKTARTEAIKAVTDYVNPADYEEAQQAEIKTIVDNAKKDIEAAKTADEIKAIEAAAKAELDKLETAEEMSLIRAIGETKFVARSKAVTLKNGKKAIKITWYDKNGKEVKFDGVEIFRSTKRYSGYGKEPIYVSKSGVYYNTAITPGTKYYYKVRGYVLVNGEKVYTDYSTKAWRTA